MFGTVLPHLRRLSLKNISDARRDGRRHVVSEPMSADTRDSLSSFDIFPMTPFNLWPTMARRGSRRDVEGSVRREYNGDTVEYVSTSYSSSDRDLPSRPRTSSDTGGSSDLPLARGTTTSGTEPLTASALQEFEARTRVDANSAMQHQTSSEDMDTGTTNDESSESRQQVRQLLAVQSNDISKDRITSSPSIDEEATGARRRFIAINRRSSSPSSSSSAPTSADFAQPFPNLWTAPMSGIHSEFDEEDSASQISWDSPHSGNAAAALGPVPLPNRDFLTLIARSCPELECLSLSGSWDWDTLLAGGGKEARRDRDFELSRIELHVDFRDVKDVERRVEILCMGIERVVKQWRKGKGRG